MEVSFSQTISLVCPQCGTTSNAEIWLIIDIVVRPDLLEKIHNGSIRNLTCPKCCQIVGLVDVPLLLYQSAGKPKLLFSPAQHTTSEEDNRMAVELVDILRKRLGKESSNEWLQQELAIVPPGLLPVILNNPSLLTQQEAMAQTAQKDIPNETLFSSKHLSEMQEISLEAHDGAANLPSEELERQLAEYPSLYEGLQAAMQQAYAGIDIPSEFQDDCLLALHYEHIYQFGGNQAVLNIMITIWRRILNHILFSQAPECFQVTALNKAGNAFLGSYHATQNSDHLDNALHCWEKANDRVSVDSPILPIILGSLARGLQARYQYSGQLEDLEQAIEISQKAIHHMPSTSPDLSSLFNNLGGSLRARYEYSGKREDLEQTIVAFQRAVECASANSPYLSRYLNNLGTNLTSRFEYTKHLEDLEQAITILQKALQYVNVDVLSLPGILARLSSSLQTRYECTKHLEDLEQAIAIANHALELVPPDSRIPHTVFENLGSNLQTYYEHSSKLDDLEQAIVFYHKAVENTPVKSPQLPKNLNNLGNCLQNHYKHTEKIENLQHAIDIFQQAVECTSPDIAFLPTILANLSNCLLAYYDHTKQIEDLERAIDVLQKAVECTSSDSTLLSTIFANLGRSLKSHYEYSGRIEDLGQAIEYNKQALQYTPPSSPNFVTICNSLATCLYASYIRSGKREDLEGTVKTLQKALSSISINSPDYPVLLGNLGIHLRDLYYITGQLEDLEQAIGKLREAVSFINNNPLALAGHLTNLGASLLDRYKYAGQLEDLEQSITNCQKVFDYVPAASPNQPTFLNNLGNSLLYYYEYSGQLDKLEQAIQCYQQATEIWSNNSQHPLYIHLSNLGSALHARYTRLGKQEDLERAIEILQAALRDLPVHLHMYPEVLNNLGVCFRSHGYLTGRSEDLEQAISTFYHALEHVPPTSSELVSRLFNNLGESLCDRYIRTKRIENLEQAIQACQKALENASPNAPNLPNFLNSLGKALFTSYEHTGSLKDLDRSIETFQRAVGLISENSVYYPSYLSNMGSSLKIRYDNTGSLKDLEQFIDVFQKAVDITTKDSPYLPGYLNNLGAGLKDLYTQTGRLDILHKANEILSQTCEIGLIRAPEVAILCAQWWGIWATERASWEEASYAYTYAIQAIEQLYRIQLFRASQESWLNEVQGLHAHAAYAMARACKLKDAVMAMEQGRARGLSEALARDRADLKQVQLIDPNLYERYLQVADRLRYFERTERDNNLLVLQDRAITNIAISLIEQLGPVRDEMEQVVTLIQRIQGYKSFLKAITYQDITRSIQHDTSLVYLATTPKGSLALLVHALSDTPEPIWANNFTADSLVDLLFNNQSEHNDIARISGYIPGQLFHRGRLSEVLAKMLPQLGKDFVSSIADRLRELGITRVILIPTGLLGLLPIHAACYQRDASSISLLDEFDIAYIPSVRMLKAVQREAQIRQNLISKTTPRFIGIANPLPDEGVGTWAQIELYQLIPSIQEAINLCKLKSQLTIVGPDERRQINKLIFRCEEILQRLQKLCQGPIEQLLHSGLDLLEARLLFTTTLEISVEVATSLIHLNECILPDLTYARAELENVQALFPANSFTTYYEHQATLDILWEALPQSTIAHFACHGSFNLENPLNSALHLACSTQLTLRDLLNADAQHFAHLHLVVLSACQTALTDFKYVPDELVGLLSGFLRAGVPSVIGTLWSVDDISTSLLITHFYELYLKGDKQLDLKLYSPARALRLAQVWLRNLTNNDLYAYLRDRSATRFLSPKLRAELLPHLRNAIHLGKGGEHPYIDPYYWAAFVYYGTL